MQAIARWVLVVLLGAILLVAAPSGTLDAQTSGPGETAFWASVGMGSSSLGTTRGLGLSYRRSHHLISARGLDVGSSESSDPLGTGARTELTEIGLMYGVGASGERSWRSISGGIGLVEGERSGTEDPDEAGESFGAVASLMLEAQLTFIASDAVGFGVTGFANVNSEDSFAGVMVSAHVGRLR